MPPRFLAVLFATAAALPSLAQGPVTVTMVADQDNTLYQSATGASSNGSGDYLFAGVNGQGEVLRAVLRFDVVNNVPAGSRIVSASLQLHASGTGAASAMTVGAHRLLIDWGEGASVATGQLGVGAPAALFDATWLHRFWPGTWWVHPGGDFAATASGVATTTAGGFQTWTSTSALVADVQQFLNQPVLNYGWLLKCPVETTAGDTRCFHSRECTTSAFQPQLTVVYLPYGAVMSVGTGCTGSNAQPLLLSPVGPVGMSFALGLSAGQPGVVAAHAVSFGIATQPLPLYAGCSLLLERNQGIATHAVLLLDGSGSGTTPFPVPNWFTGMEVALQSLALDPGLPARFVLSNALLLRLP
jgi:hypothetical protein